MTERQKYLGTVAYMGGIMAIPEPFTWAFSEMREFSREALCKPDEAIYATRARVSLHDAARNKICNDMRGDWVMMFDCDLDFEPDITARLVRLMYQFDLDVVTGLYCFKDPPYNPELWLWNEKARMHEQVNNWAPDDPSQPTPPVFEISVAGGGALLIRKRVIDRITADLGELPFARLISTIQPGVVMGEDFSFFDRCRRLGIKAHCAHQVHAYHLRFQGADPDYRPTLPTLASYKVPSYGIPA